MNPKLAAKISKILHLTAKVVYFLPGIEMPRDIYIQLSREISGSKREIEEKIEEAFSSLNKTSELLHELEMTLRERTEKLSILKDDYQRYSELALIEQNKAEAIMRQISFTVDSGKNRERIVGFIINIVAGLILFILGIWLGPFLTKIFFGS
ncbi:hypothetical protein [Paenibacillus alkalitolerans]|uniref:hypothetical protein n=1 Tax=Paenibacillus alkalitolerans TaxID=2799335 RepID=UPI0018F620FC|nr:hypothetical protein [Paenibacillus alkalitolerans]